MAFDRNHIRLTASGTLGPDSGAQEIFSWSLKFAGSTGTDALIKLADTSAEDVWDVVAAFHSSVNAFIHPDANLASIKLAAISTAGLYLADAVTWAGSLTSGGGAGARPPNQIALCYSLRTNTNLGRATKGRVYQPLPTMVWSSQGHMNVSSDQLSARSEFVDMCDALNAIMDTGAEAMRLSLMSDIGAGTTRTVTQIRLGDVPDTIRSRREALPESYAMQDLA